MMEAQPYPLEAWLVVDEEAVAQSLGFLFGGKNQVVDIE